MKKSGKEIERTGRQLFIVSSTRLHVDDQRKTVDFTTIGPCFVWSHFIYTVAKVHSVPHVVDSCCLLSQRNTTKIKIRLYNVLRTVHKCTKLPRGFRLPLAESRTKKNGTSFFLFCHSRFVLTSFSLLFSSFCFVFLTFH